MLIKYRKLPIATHGDSLSLEIFFRNSDICYYFAPSRSSRLYSTSNLSTGLDFSNCLHFSDSARRPLHCIYFEIIILLIIDQCNCYKKYVYVRTLANSQIYFQSLFLLHTLLCCSEVLLLYTFPIFSLHSKRARHYSVGARGTSRYVHTYMLLWGSLQRVL